MTRKKSNVKALALAVTCAILAGGYSGLNPVYAAADTLYKEGNNVTTSSTPSVTGGGTNTEITELTVGGVTIGGTGEDAGQIIAKNIVGIKNASAGTLSDIHINGATFASGGAITANGGLTTNSVNIGGLTISSVNSGSTISATNYIAGIKNSTGTVTAIDISGTKFESSGAITATSLKLGELNVGSSIEDNKNALTKLGKKTANISDDGKTLSNMTEVGATKVSATTLEVGGRVINGEKVDGYDAAVKNTAKITQNTDGSTAVNDVTFNAGAVSGVKSINDKIKFSADGTVTSINGGIKISADGKTVTFNEGEPNGQVQISATGIKVGTGSTYISGDAVYTGGADYDAAKAGMKKDGSLKAAGDAFKVEGANGNVTTTGDIEGKNITASGALKGASLDVTGDISTNGNVTAKGGLSAANNAFKVDGANGDISTDGSVTAKGGLSAANDKFKVDGANGNTAVGGTLGVTGAATVGGTLGVTGAATVGGTLGVTGNISTDGSVTAKGGLSAANGNFTVEGTTGNTAVGGTLGVTGNAIVGGTLDVTGDISTNGSVTAKGGLSAANGKFTVDGANGNTAVDGTLKSKGNFSVGDSEQFTVDAANGNVVSKGKITSENATIGAVEIANDGTITGVKAITTESLTVNHGFITNGNIESKGLKVNGDAKITGTLGVDGAVTGASFNGAAITATTFNGATIDATHFNNVTLSGGDVEANAITGTTVTGTTVTDGAGASMNAGTVTGTKITDGVATMTGGNLTGVNSITASGNITTSGTIKGGTLTDGVATMNGGQVTAENGLVVNTDNQLTSAGLKADDISAKKGQIGNIKIDGATITSNTGTGLSIEGVNINNTALGNVTSIDGVSVGAVTGGNGLEFGGNAVIGATNKPFSSTGYEVDGEGNVTGKSFNVNGSNYLDSTGLTTEKAVIGGVNTLNDKGIDTSKNLHVGGQATFGNSTSGNYTTVNGGKVDITANGGTTTIEGAKITTKTLDVEDIILRNEMKDGTGATINIKGSDGSMSVAGGKFKVDANGQVTNHITATGAAAADTIFTTSETGIDATFQKNGEAASSGLKIDHNHAALNASGGAALDLKDKTATLGIGTDSLTTYTSDAIESKVGADASRTLKATEIIDAVGSTTVTTKSGGTTFGDGTANNTLIYGSAITSTNGGATGVLDGSNLTLTNGANSTALTAGGATFTGANGRSDATGVKNQTTIDGGIITTDTLNVQRIELGDKLVDSNGTSHGSKLSMDEYGNIKAAGGNFTVAGTNQTNPGALHNEVGGKTFLDTTETGASMKFDNTAATDGVKSEVSVEANKATVAAGDKASFVANTDNGGTATITGGTQTVTTTDAGTVFKNSAHKDPFGGGIVTETTINGNEITTGKITTDQLVIKGNGSGAAAGAGSGSIALGGNGSIMSNIKKGTKEATFKTDETGTFTEAKDGANKTTNTVNAQGNTNVVTDGTNTSTATQTATAIGGVITNGTVKLAEAELNKDGFTVKQKDKTDVKIADGDVTVTNNRNTTDPQYANQTVHLSDLGSLNNLDGELEARDEYQNNKTAVGAINAEAGIRREEVARLDNRIDDVNNRVDKVGAMAAAIASLKSIGYDPQAPSEFSIGLGQYKGETGVAMGFFHYPNKNFMINVSLSTAGGETMGGIGATWRFGHKSPQKLLDEQREAQARKELAAAEKYQAAAKLAKEAQERAEYAAKLARQAQVSADNAKAAADATQAKHFQ